MNDIVVPCPPYPATPLLPAARGHSAGTVSHTHHTHYALLLQSRCRHPVALKGGRGLTGERTIHPFPFTPKPLYSRDRHLSLTLLPSGWVGGWGGEGG